MMIVSTCWQSRAEYVLAIVNDDSKYMLAEQGGVCTIVNDDSKYMLAEQGGVCTTGTG